jgi:RNA polymerase sigma-70 factor (ECF subfamily)
MSRTLIPLRRHEGTVEEMSDEALMAAAGTGATAAIGALFDRHHQQVHRFLCRLSLVDAAEIDDLIQATFAELPKLAKKFRGDSQVSTFILGIAKNKARTLLRSAGRRRRLTEAVYEEHRETPPTALELVSKKEEAVNLANAVAALPLKIREATVLVYFEGLSGTEAAKALGIREGTLWKRLHVARETLRKTQKVESV